MKGENYQIREFGLIRKAVDFNRDSGSVFSANEVYLPAKSFESLLNFVLDNQSIEGSNDSPFTVFRKQKHHQIKVKNFVGVIETKDGISIEILPKIYDDDSVDGINKTRAIFLKMLKYLKDSPFKTLGTAHLKTRKDFPVLEVFISSFILECENLISNDLKHDYISNDDNLNFIRGKFLVTENIKHNFTQKEKFFCRFSEYSGNIPQNKIIKSALIKLAGVTKSYSNLSSLITLINKFDSIDTSEDLEGDLRLCSVNNRLYIKYHNILLWAGIFLLNKSFTNFKGTSVNTAVLFPMEKIFESYIAHLLKKYCKAHSINSQDKRYCLIGQMKNGRDNNYSDKQFPLKPDIVINDSEVIIDTKWKIINEGTKKFGIKEADIYQMHAYGRRYENEREDNSPPRLALIYPKNSFFKNKLLQMRYGNDLLLDILPFDFENDNPEKAIQNIVNELFKPKPYLIAEDDYPINLAADSGIKYGK